MGRRFFIAIGVGVLVLSSVSLGYTGGAGTPENPYQIASKDDLLALAGTTEDYNKCFVLTADINMAGQVFTTAIIAADTDSSYGFQGTSFAGVFDGNSHKITNFTINSGGSEYLGLIGQADSGEIKNLGLEDFAVSGLSGYSYYVGGMVGYNYYGSITNSYSIGSFYGSLFNVGGLVGENYRGSISNCYSIGDVNGSSHAGGLVGKNSDGTITRCCSTGSVSGESFVGGLVGSSSYEMASISDCYSTSTVSSSWGSAGGLVGENSYASISNCYSAGEVSDTHSSYGVGGLAGVGGGTITGCYFLATSGPDNGHGQPLSDEQMKQQVSFVGWDFLGETANGTCNYWYMPPDAYPVLSIFSGHIPPELPGSGTADDPYIIADANDLGTVWFRPSANYILANDIDLSGVTWSMSVVPTFNGVFDGNGFCIGNLFVNGERFFGLLGETSPGSQIKNLRLENCTISGTHSCAGGLVAYNSGSITNCSSTGTVSGVYNCGGLVGCNDGSILNCYAMGDVNGNSNVGGLVAYNSGSITNCSSTGTVRGGYAGGLVGFNNGNINNCFSTTSISGFNYVGGMVGYNYYGSITNSYSIGSVSGSSYVGGLVGDGEYGSIINCYSTGIVSGTGNYIGGLVGSQYKSSITGCYFLAASGPDNGHGQPLTDAQMKQQASFVGWDFLDEAANGTCGYWYMPPDAYPVLSIFSGHIPPEPPGSGTEIDPYIITDADALGTVWFRPSAYYILADDINLAGIQWSLSVVPDFSGVFDGNGFTIDNLSINGGSYLGLFGMVHANSQIKNLGLEYCNISGSGYYVGGLVGYNSGSITNCYSTGTVSGTSSEVGGLVGSDFYGGTISNCFSTASISGYSHVGGLVGRSDQGIITHCYSTGDVSGDSYVGGLVGDNYYYSNINCSYSTGSVSGTSYVGGLVGENGGNIVDCYSTGAVSGNSYVGGLVGNGYFGSSINCYSTGIVSGTDSYIGALVGRQYQGSITGCYFLNTSGPDNGHGQPLSDEQMKQQASFVGWDFSTPVWTIEENIDYPHLRWEGIILYVPDCYPTIQSAIDAAINGDTVIVAPGTYTGLGNHDIDFLGKAITVRSSDPNDPNIVAATIIDCIGHGYGFYFLNGEDTDSILAGFTITNCGYGGILCRYESSPIISRCIIMDNFGTGIYCWGSSPTISHCIIMGNSGSGISCWDSNAVITDCTITGNFALGEGGGIYCFYPSSPTITNCTITGNYVDAGGGGGIYGCDGPITNCTIAGNSAAFVGCGGGGGLIDCSGSVTNCIIWGNWPDQIYSDYIPVAITYSDIQGGYPGLGNVDIDPCFVDTDANDYHLKSQGWSWDAVRKSWTYDDVTSRCIDAGNPGSPLGDELLSVPRDPDNEWGQNLRINMGAFGGTAEASIPPYDWALLSDITNDGISDYSDIGILSSLWLNTGEQLYADFNRDEIIDLFDFALLAQDWLEQTTWY